MDKHYSVVKQKLEPYLLNKSHLEAQTESCVIKSPALSLSCTFTCMFFYVVVLARYLLHTNHFWKLGHITFCETIQLGEGLYLFIYRKNTIRNDKAEY